MQAERDMTASQDEAFRGERLLGRSPGAKAAQDAASTFKTLFQTLARRHISGELFAAGREHLLAPATLPARLLAGLLCDICDLNPCMVTYTTLH